MTRAATGFRVHSGWGAAVTLAGPKGAPLVLDRRRIELVDGSPGSKQPYHAAEGLPFAAAEARIERARKSTWLLASRGLEEIMRAHPIGACCVLVGSGRPLPELARILASHPLLHTAEGVFFRQALIDAAREHNLAVRTIQERELAGACATELKLPPATINQRLADWGRALGPPWRQDEKFAALAAWLAL